MFKFHQHTLTPNLKCDGNAGEIAGEMRGKCGGKCGGNAGENAGENAEEFSDGTLHLHISKSLNLLTKETLKNLLPTVQKHSTYAFELF